MKNAIRKNEQLTTVRHNGRSVQFLHPLPLGRIGSVHATGAFYESDLLEAIRLKKRSGVYLDVGAGQ